MVTVIRMVASCARTTTAKFLCNKDIPMAGSLARTTMAKHKVLHKVAHLLGMITEVYHLHTAMVILMAARHVRMTMDLPAKTIPMTMPMAA